MARLKGWSFDDSPVDPPMYSLSEKPLDYGSQLGANNPKLASGAGQAASIGALASANPYLIGASAAFSIVSGLHEAETIRANAAVTAKINEMNAQSLEFDAYKAQLNAEAEVASYQVQIDQTKADQRAAFASQGVDVNFGTAAQVQSETEVTGFLNKLEMQKQGRARALGITRQARNLRLQGSAQDAQSSMAAQSAQTGGILRGGIAAATGYSRK